jgi:hypothetical protein
MITDLDQTIKQVLINKEAFDPTEVDISFEKTFYDPPALSGRPLDRGFNKAVPLTVLSIQERDFIHKENKRIV